MMFYGSQAYFSSHSFRPEFMIKSIYHRVYHFIGVEQIFSAMIGYVGVILLSICMDFMSKRSQNTISKLIRAAFKFIRMAWCWPKSYHGLK